MAEDKVEKKVEGNPEEKVEESKEYVLVEVPTGSALAIRRPNNEVITSDQAIVEILNKLGKIEEAVA